MTQAQPRRIGVVARLRYRFDTAMSRGTGIIILWLGGITFGLVFIAALVLTVFGIGVNEDKTPSLLERFWQSLLRILDPGTFSGDAGWPLRITMLLVTLLGVLIGGSLIGLIVAGVDSKVEQLRRGRSVVAERGHTLILGWSPRIFTLISEIVEANANQRRGCIVVLASEEKPTMEEAVGSAWATPRRRASCAVPVTRPVPRICSSRTPTRLARSSSSPEAKTASPMQKR
jgi:ion channel POLLUX/CASTOR